MRKYVTGSFVIIHLNVVKVNFKRPFCPTQSSEAVIMTMGSDRITNDQWML